MAKFYRLIVRRECEITNTGPVVERRIVRAYAVVTKGRTFLTTNAKVAERYEKAS